MKELIHHFNRCSIYTRVNLSLNSYYQVIVTVVHIPTLLFTLIFPSSSVTSCLTNESHNQNPSVHLAASPCQNGSRMASSCSGVIHSQVSVMVSDDCCASIVTFPPGVVNFAALSTILLTMRSKDH